LRQKGKEKLNHHLQHERKLPELSF